MCPELGQLYTGIVSHHRALPGPGRVGTGTHLSSLFAVFDAEMEPFFVLITFWNIGLYQVSKEGNESGPQSQFMGGPDAGIFDCLMCHNIFD